MKKKISILLVFVKTMIICFMTINSKATDGILLNLVEKKTSKNTKESKKSNNETPNTLSPKQTKIADVSEKTEKENEGSKDQKLIISQDIIEKGSKKSEILISNESQKQLKNSNGADENLVKISKATTTIFLSGLFDKSFFITAFMAMKYSKWIVLFSTSLSLSLIGILSVFLGVTINQYVSVVWIDSFAVALFLIFGVHMIYEGVYMKEDEQTEVQILGRKSADAENDEEKGLLRAPSDDAEKDNYSSGQDGGKICDCSGAAEKKKQIHSKFKGQSDCNSIGNNSKIFYNKGSGKNKRIENNEVVPMSTNSFNFISQKGKESNNNSKAATAAADYWDKNGNINNNSASDSLTNPANCEQTLNEKSDNLTISDASTTHSIFCCEKSKEYYNNNLKDNSNKTCINKNKSTANEAECFEENNKIKKIGYTNNKENTQNEKKAEIDLTNYLCNNSIQVFSKVFFLIFFSEIGDRSQISTIYLTTNFDKFSVIIAVVVSSTFLTILAVFGGKLLANKISEKKLTIFAGWVFIVFGLVALYLLLVGENANEGLNTDSNTAASVSAGNPSVILNEMIIPNSTNKIKQKIH